MIRLLAALACVALAGCGETVAQREAHAERVKLEHIIGISGHEAAEAQQALRAREAQRQQERAYEALDEERTGG